MNFKEFAALKAGDKIENAMTNSKGEVAEVTKYGLEVTWGGPLKFFYSAASTAWMHWSKVDDQG